MLRSLNGVIAGVVAWIVAATLANMALRALLPGYAEVEMEMIFTLPMLDGRLVVGVIASLAAGATCAAIARGSSTAEVLLAGLLVLIFLPIHYALWAKFPVWYHVAFLVSIAPLVLAGAELLRRARRAR
jgi:hypothetical protein